MNAPFFFAADAALRTAFPRAIGRWFLTIPALISLTALLPSPASAQLYTETSTLPSGGERVSISGDTVLLGVVGNQPPHENTPTYHTGVYVKGASGWALQQFVEYQGGDAAIDGNTLVVGNSVYVRAGTTWTLQAKVSMSDRTVNALRGDTLVQAFPFDRTQDVGHVMIWIRDGASWTVQAHLYPQDSNQRLGTSLALDGDTVIAGTDDWLQRSGGAYVFVRKEGAWSFEANLKLSGAGILMDVAVEGNTAAVSDPTNSRVGIFTRSGSSWTLAQTLAGSTNGFGSRIVMRGGVLAVREDTMVHLYTRNASGWVLSQTVTGASGGDMALSEGGKALVSGGGQVFSVPPPPPPGSGWRDFDIGAVGVAGSSADNGGTVAVRGSGADIWGAGDQFHYRSESLVGDGAIIARVDAIGGGHPWSKAGLMAREDIAPASRNVMALVAAGGPVGMQVRAGTADNTNFIDGPWLGAPLWLMLARQGNLFASYRSNDGENWTPIGSATIALPATIHVGLAVSSHDNTALNTGTFSHVELVGLPPPNPPAAPANLQAGNQTSTTVALSWTDNSSNETGFEVQRSPGNGSGAFTVVTTTAANSTSYVDSALTPDTEYTYRVRAVRDGVFSAVSNTFTIRTLRDTNPGWSSADIGNVGPAGSTSASGSAVTLAAGGEDIWNQADGFRFHYRAWQGDGTITARVAALGNTHPWAKAGVMIRESLAANSPNAAVVITAAAASGFQTRPTAGAETEFASGPWVNAPYWVRVTRSGNLFSGYVSPDGVNWTPVGSRTLAMASTVYIGLAASAHTTAAQTMASFDNVTVPEGPPPPPPPPPSDWTKQLWGSATGSISSAGTGVTLTATGDDIWNTSDSGLFAWRDWAGNGDFAVRVDSMTATHPWAKAGIMIRSGTAANATNAFVALTPGVGAVFQVRDGAGQSTTLQQNWTPGPGSWLRLSVQDDLIAAYYSVTEGASWVYVGTLQYRHLPTDTVGLAVSSHDSNAATTVNFSGFRTSPIPPSNVRVTHLGPGGEVDLAWDDNSSDETGFVIERYIPDPPRPYYTPFATVPANTPRAVLTLTQGQAFSLRVRAVSNALTSGYSNAVGGIATKTPDLVVQGRTATSITLRLDCPSVPYGYPMSGPFAVERSTNGTNFTVIATLHTSDIRYTDEGLSPGTNYYYRARYIDDQGNTSAYSSVRGPVQTSTP